MTSSPDQDLDRTTAEQARRREKLRAAVFRLNITTERTRADLLFRSRERSIQRETRGARGRR